MKENLVKEKSYRFALRIVKLGRFLISEQKEFIISKQIIRCGTSVGANIEEAEGAQSKKDFIAKLQISLKEARETHYWLRIIKDTELINKKLAESLLQDINDMIALLTKILKTAKVNNEKLKM